MNKIETLKHFSNLCDDNELGYYLFGKTLHDAITKKEMSSSDDDIIVVMTRRDFDRMHDYYANNKLDTTYKFTGLKAGKGSFPYAKFGLSKKNNILIFPIDGVPMDEDEYKSHMDKLKELNDLYDKSANVFSKMKEVLGGESKMTRYAKEIDALARKYDIETSPVMQVVVGREMTPGKLDRDSFLPEKEIVFCGEMFKTTLGFFNYLNSVYGDIPIELS